MKKIVMLVALLTGVGTFYLVGPAQATNPNEGGDPCYAQVVDKEAYDEPVKVIDTPAQDAVPGKWWNFSPNRHQGPFEGPPAFPTDERGTWEGPHTEGGPGQDQVGTFQQGNGHGSWFHREAGTPAVEEVSHTEYVHHDAVTHEEEVPCVDVCPDIEGDQPEGTDCTPVVPPVDACPQIEGNQPWGTDCRPPHHPVDKPTGPKPVKDEPKADSPDVAMPNTGA